MGNPKTLTRTMSDDLRYKIPSSRSASGAVTYGSLQTVTDGAKYWEEQRITRTNSGEETVTMHYCHTYTEIKKGYKIWLPDEDTSTDAGHIVDDVSVYASAAVRGAQWTLYEVKIGFR